MPDTESTTVAGVRLTSPGRVLYPGQGLTKAELATFYVDLAEHVLPHVVARPLSVVRCPRGREGQCFYQKHHTESMPKPVHGVEIEEKDGRALYLVIHDLAGLVSLVQIGVLEIHPWSCREDRIERPDRLIFDLDPAPEVGFEAVKEAAREVGDRLAELGLVSFLRTTGGKGLHVVAPLVRRVGWDELKGFAHGVAEAMSADSPERYLATASKEKRRGKIFVDYLRNSRGATAVASYSTRARAGAPVATPLAWEELAALPAANVYTVANLRQRLAALEAGDPPPGVAGAAGDPWDGFFTLRQSLTRAMLRAVGAG